MRFIDKADPAHLEGCARAEWARFSEDERAVVRFGMIPADAARRLEAETGATAREIALALFKAARDAGAPLVV